MRLIVMLTTLLLMAPFAYAGQQDLELRSEIFTDNDNTHNFSIDEVLHWKDSTTKLGLGATQTFIRESAKDRKYYGGLIEGYQKLDKVELSGQLKVVDWGGKTRTPLSLESSQRLGSFRLVENVGYGLIDSLRAYDARIDFWTVGGELEYSLNPFVLTGGYWHRWSSDNNERDAFVARAVYDLSDSLHLQYRYRGFRNSERVPEYYSPEDFDQQALLFGYFDSFFNRIRLKLWIGPVLQDDGFDTDLGLLEDLRAVCKIDDHWSLSLMAVADQVGSGYQYVYSTLSVIYDF